MRLSEKRRMNIEGVLVKTEANFYVVYDLDDLEVYFELYNQ